MTGWRDALGSEGSTVDCIACGETLACEDAREYDRYGDRWDRADKRFEYLCKPCYDEQCHLPRDGLEETLVEAGAGDVGRRAFLRSFRRLDAREAGADSEE
jgi:hypothetical protein